MFPMAALFYHSAVKLNLDPSPLFAKAAALLAPSGTLQKEMSGFPSRPVHTLHSLEAFRLRERTTDDGFGYESIPEDGWRNEASRGAVSNNSGRGIPCDYRDLQFLSAPDGDSFAGYPSGKKSGVGLAQYRLTKAAASMVLPYAVLTSSRQGGNERFKSRAITTFLSHRR